MAEFKLGRIRFVWKNTWSASTQYFRDDVVNFGNKMYICVIGHTSAANFFTDFDIVPPKWNLVADGQTWKTGWEPQVEYIPGDIVKYGARLYIANTAHTSAADSTAGLEADSSYWDVYAEGLEWKGNWSTSFDYKVNDLVKYGGFTYVCNQEHISASTDALGLENDQSYWDEFNKGIEYKGDWSTTPTRYKINDVVRYGGNVYICTTYHTSTDQFTTDEANWTLFVQGVQGEGEWEAYVDYQIGDVVKYGGYQYISKTNNNSVIPTSSTDDWDIFAKGFSFVGVWGEDSSQQDYKVGEVVRVNGYTYVAKQDSNGIEPNLTANWTDYWDTLNQGFEWRGEWIDDAEYKIGDIVRFGDNNFVCVASHISEGDDGSSGDPDGNGPATNESSRPDLDSGAYWNLFTIGSELSVLSVKGDLVYYSASGPTRLPVGEEGQVLKVSSDGIPEWDYFGVATDVYYVSNVGTDEASPKYGRSIDRPWKTIRYAAQQVEEGPKNPQAAELLELNRIFIQREIVEWTDAQITGNISPFTTAFTYETYKCERDMGFIVDALLWDIKHGGNVRSREAALKYVQEPGNFYTLGQEEETVASINYGLTVIQNVLNQTDPAVNYQTTNGDNSTAIVAQYKNSSVTAESGVYADITALVKIITDAITAGVATNIPAKNEPTTLIRVATGTYKEVLPIIVPRSTCIMGDELRATTAKPRVAADGLTPRGDVQFSFQAIERMENIIGDVVQGIAVTPTTGNNETQSMLWPYGEQAQADAAKQLSRTLKRRIDWLIGDKIERDMPLPDNRNITWYYARELLLQNKEFIKAEVIARITTLYPNLLYSKTKCKQDTGYIIDAIAYDLTYDGNWQSVNAGEAYFNGATGTLQIDSSEKTATLAAYGYLKSICAQIVQANPLASPAQEVELQVTGTGGSSATGTKVQDLFDDIIDIITNGTGSVSIVYPTVTQADAALQTASTNIANAKDAIGIDVIDFISLNFGSFKYNSAKCRRDLTNILTDVAFDIALGTNYNAVFNGIAYQRPNNTYNLNVQRTETIGAIQYARDEAATSVAASATAVSRSNAAFNEIVDILENGTLGASEPGDGVVNALTFPAPSALPTANADDAADHLQNNRAFLQAEVIAYIENEIADGPGSSGSAIWDGFVYNSTKCERDIGYIVDALTYDLLYGGNSASIKIAESYFVDGIEQVYGQSDQTAAAYAHLSTVAQDVIQGNLITKSPGNGETQDQSAANATGTEATALDTNLQIIEDAISNQTLDGLPAEVTPSVTWTAADLQSAKTALDGDQAQIILDTIQYINTTYSNFNYNQAKCSRDIGLILDAARYDFQLGTNFASIVAAISYLREPSSKVVGNQKDATIAANEYAKQLAVQKVTGIDTAITGVETTFEWVNDMILSGSEEGSNDAVADQNNYAAIQQLELNKDFIVQEVKSHVDEYFKDTVVETQDSSNTLTISNTNWLSTNLAIEFETLQDSTNAVANANLATGTTYYVKDILDSMSFTISETPGGTAINLSDEFGQYTVKAAYDYNEALCTRDVKEYINAIKWDLAWPKQWKRTYVKQSDDDSSVDITFFTPGIYKTNYAARYYANAVLGSQEEDFYYMRNATGLRLQTLDGLSGDLTPANAFSTSRVTAGAYASLDPGWGPDDERVWIDTRSPYMQNNTCFGTCAIGQKIDGALHNGGNDSMVSNDFTQIISDGIGAWITNNGRAELVSVFTYYSHVGYLAENGGRIRATNGNNSYGKFGSVAEGVDPDETPVAGIVDNKLQFSATISNVETDNDVLLQLEYRHAGDRYTDVNYNIFGNGSSESLFGDEFRDRAVSHLRILDINDSSGKEGGSGYLTVSNTAQAGSTTSLTLAATDGSLSTAYPGMKILISGGAGVGQYAIIDTYDAGTKLATVIKESDSTAGWDHWNPGTTIVAPNSTSTYIIEPNVSFSAPPRSSSPHTIGVTNTYHDLHFMKTAEIYTGVSGTSSGDGSGATFDIERVGSHYYVSLNSGGSGYTRLETITIDGTSLDGITSTNDLTITITSINSSTGAITTFDTDGYGLAGLFIALADDTSAAKSVDGQTWSALTMPSAGSGGQWRNVDSGLIDDGSSDFKTSAAIAVTRQTLNYAYSTDGVSWTSSTLPTGVGASGEKYVAFGQIGDVGRFVVINESSQTVAYSDNGGTTWIDVASALPATGYAHLTFGQGQWVAMKGTTAAADDAVYSTDGITWTQGTTVPTGLTVTDMAFGKNRFIAIDSSANKAALSLNGRSWQEIDLPSIDGSSINNYTQIAYGQGVFVAVSDNSAVSAGGDTVTEYNSVVFSEDGLYWQVQGLDDMTDNPIQGFNAVGFGNPQFVGQFIGIDSAAAANTAVRMRIGCTARGRAGVANEQVFEVRLWEPGSGYYDGTPTTTITDPNNIYDVLYDVQLSDGALGNPTFINRGSGFIDASAEIDSQTSNGYALFVQSGSFIAVRQLSEVPVAGSNVVFGSNPNTVYKLVNVVSLTGTVDGDRRGFLNLSPAVEKVDSPTDGSSATLRIRYSQVRLTGHDFLDIGTGNFQDSNYPNTPVNDPDPNNETLNSDGGRVFFTSTDQDGNFRVGDLFSIEQSTGVATLNADAFNIAGLQELTLGEVSLGGNSAAITEFSTDPFFTANSDTVVPTQRAIKSYIEAQIGGGGAALNVNSVTAGDIFIGTNQITTVSGAAINITAPINFKGSVRGVPVALGYFLR